MPRSTNKLSAMFNIIVFNLTRIERIFKQCISLTINIVTAHGNSLARESLENPHFGNQVS